MKKIVRQLNRKLPEMLKEKPKPALVQAVFKPEKAEGVKIRVESEKTIRYEIWKPKVLLRKRLRRQASRRLLLKRLSGD